MATATIHPINLAYGRGLASLRSLLKMSQGAFGEEMGEMFGDDYRWSQATVSDIEKGKRALQADEIETVVAFFAELTALSAEEVWSRLRPKLRLEGEAEARPNLTVIEGRSRFESHATPMHPKVNPSFQQQTLSPAA